MGMVSAFRSYYRMSDGIGFPIGLDEWPDDVPLPPGATQSGPAAPNCQLRLESSQTVEMIGGWFRAPLPMGELIQWYQTKMPELGWIAAKPAELLPTNATLYFASPDDSVHAFIGIHQTVFPESTALTLYRAFRQPWLVPEQEISLPPEQ